MKNNMSSYLGDTAVAFRNASRSFFLPNCGAGGDDELHQFPRRRRYFFKIAFPQGCRIH